VSKINTIDDNALIGSYQGKQFKELDATSKKAAVQEFVKEKTGWQLEEAGSGCWRNLLGAYVGVPTSFDMNVDFTAKNKDGIYEDQSSRRKGELKPLVSAGITLSPFSEVRLMIGATLSNVVLREDGPNTRVWTWTIALGGNLDIAGALLSK